MTRRDEEISIRERDGAYLFNACVEWLERARAANTDDFIVSEIGRSYEAEIPEIESKIEAITMASSSWQRLVMTEVLADALYQMVKAGRLGTRTPPIDALEEFLYTGKPRSCLNHPDRHGAFQEGERYLCAHCIASSGGSED